MVCVHVCVCLCVSACVCVSMHVCVRCRALRAGSGQGACKSSGVTQGQMKRCYFKPDTSSKICDKTAHLWFPHLLKAHSWNVAPLQRGLYLKASCCCLRKLEGTEGDRHSLQDREMAHLMAQLGLTLSDLSPHLLHIQGPWGPRCHLGWGQLGRREKRCWHWAEWFWTWHT